MPAPALACDSSSPAPSFPGAKERISAVVHRGQPGAAKSPEIVGSAEETGMPGDAAQRIRAFIVNHAVDQAATPLMVEFSGCNARQERRVRAKTGMAQAQWSADQVIDSAIERLPEYCSNNVAQKQRIDIRIGDSAAGVDVRAMQCTLPSAPPLVLPDRAWKGAGQDRMYGSAGGEP